MVTFYVTIYKMPVCRYYIAIRWSTIFSLLASVQRELFCLPFIIKCTINMLIFACIYAYTISQECMEILLVLSTFHKYFCVGNGLLKLYEPIGLLRSLKVIIQIAIFKSAF